MDIGSSSTRTQTASGHRRHVGVALAALAAVAVVVYGTITAVRLVSAYNDMVEGRALLLSAGRALREDGLETSPATLSDAEMEAAEARTRFGSARDAMAGQPLLGLAERLPWLGDQVSAAKALAQIGYEGSEIGLAGVSALRTFNDATAADGTLGENAMAYLDASEPMMSDVEQGLDSIRQMRSAIDAGRLLPPLQGFVRQLDAEIAPVEESVARFRHARAAAGHVLGYEGVRSHLALGLDNTELLPAGGLIGMYGVVTLDRGRMSERNFGEVKELVADWQALSGGEYVEPPLPLKRYLLRDWTWNFAVSGWSPDFPTSARQALSFYERSGAEPPEDVIAMDFVALEGLLAVLGPTPIDGYAVTVDSENATEEILARIGRPLRPEDGDHAFAAAVASRVMDGVLAADREKLAPLLETLDRLARERHLLLYSGDAPTQRALESLGWAGEVKDTPGDYLMAVDASVHSSKLNLVLQERMTVDIRIGANGSSENAVTLDYENRLDEWALGRPPELVAQMLSGFYGGYLRLLAPPRAELREVLLNGRAAGAEEVTEEARKASFGRYFALPKGSDAAVTFVYRVPDVVDRPAGQHEYRLLIQKQAGAAAIPLTLSVAVPDGASVQSVSLDGELLPAASPEIRTDLAEDRELVVRYG